MFQKQRDSRKFYNKLYILNLSILSFVVMISTMLLLLFEEEYLFQSIILLILVLCGGRWMITRLSIKLKDDNIKYISYVLYIKVIIGILLLYLTWAPWLDISSEYYGYDPQRNYFDAFDLAENNFSLEYLVGINYAGILYYYGLIFYIFGHNPIIPMLINYIMALYGVILLIQVCYIAKNNIEKYDWMLGFVMIIPDILWYDLLTSKESLLMSLLSMLLLTIGGLIIKKPGDSFSSWNLILVPICLLLIGIIRTPMVLPVIFIIGIYVIFKFKSYFLKYSPILIITIILVFAMSWTLPSLSKIIGSHDSGYNEMLSGYLFVEDPADPDLHMDWNEGSAGLLFVSKDWKDALLYSPIRVIVYLITPIPNIFLDYSKLLNGNFDAWQHLMSLSSSVLYVIFMPFAITPLWKTIKERKWLDSLVVVLPFWVLITTIAVGNYHISIRYRVMSIPLLIGSIWLGKRDDIRIIRNAYFVWAIVLICGGISYLTYKQIL